MEESERIRSGLSTVLIGEAVALIVTALTMFGLSLGIWGIASPVAILYGLYRLKEIDPDYETAFYLTIGRVAATLLGTLFMLMSFDAAWMAALVLIVEVVVERVLQYQAVLHICKATLDQEAKLGGETDQDLGGWVVKLTLVSAVVTVAVLVFPLAAAAAPLFSIVVGVVEIVALGALCLFLYRAMKRFN